MFFCYLQYPKFDAFQQISLWGVELGFILAIYFKIARFLTRKSLHGEIGGFLAFGEKGVTVNGKLYSIDEIRRIEFFVHDYFDKLDFPSRGDFNPGRSNGVGNFCEVTLVDGSSLRIYFQLHDKEEFLNMRDILIHYHFNKKISFLRLIEYLGIDKYEEIQDFKRILNNLKKLAGT